MKLPGDLLAVAFPLPASLPELPPAALQQVLELVARPADDGRAVRLLSAHNECSLELSVRIVESIEYAGARLALKKRRHQVDAIELASVEQHVKQRPVETRDQTRPSPLV